MNNITFLLPTKNHENSILKNFQKLDEFCKENIEFYEILIISNGSSNNSVQLIIDLKKHKFVRHIILDLPGKGRAVRHGLINSKYDNVVMYDSDFSYNINYVKKFFDVEGKPFSSFIYISRKISKQLIKNTPLLRLAAGRVYNFLIKVILKIDSSDTQAGFKYIDKSNFTNCTDFKSNDFDFDIELFLLAKKAGIKALPINIKDVIINEHSNVGIVNDSLGMFKNLFKIKKLYL